MTVSTTEAIETEQASSGYSKTTRRQYQSCDQCRKSRRACDAATLRVANFPLSDHDGTGSHLASTIVDACSNCARTSKKCSFNWLRSLPKQGLPKGVKRKLESSGFHSDDGTNELKEDQVSSRATKQFPASTGPSLFQSPQSLYPEFDPAEDFARSTYQDPHKHARSSDQHLKPPAPTFSVNGKASKLPSTSQFNARSATNGHDSGRVVEYSKTKKQGPETLLRQNTSSSVSSSSSDSSNSTVDGKIGTDSSEGQAEPEHGRALGPSSYRQYTNSPPPAKRANYGSTDHELRRVTSDHSSGQNQTSGRSAVSSVSYSSRRTSPMPLSPRQVRFADGAIKAMIATGLLRIYNDSFENSLWCWATERNCPFERDFDVLNKQAAHPSMFREAAMKMPDNRIFSRVSRLDEAFASLRGRPVSASESKAATKALNAAIMAFASQWSHSSHNSFWKSKEGKSQSYESHSPARGSFGSATRSIDHIMSTECEKMIQRTLWHEAKNAIHSAVETDSFKIILAYMIFAITQRPGDSEKRSRESKTLLDRSKTESGRRGSDESSWSDVAGSDSSEYPTVSDGWDPYYVGEMDPVDSPPMYLEASVRSLFTWRHRFERWRRMRSRNISKCGGSHANDIAQCDQQTFNILFWLGIMCDTTLSAIIKRPFVIPDEDCGIIRSDFDTPNFDDETSSTSTRRKSPPATSPSDDDEDHGETLPMWGDYLLRFKWGGPRETPPRWPCAFEDAALVLQEATPVKVLMFRKVGQLQTLAYRRHPARKMEKCIEEAIAAYTHWNETYGPFMADCVKAHSTLPAHVQSWYVILAGHWHYGCLLLADAIDQVDQEGRTMAPQRDLRAQCNITAELRRENAQAIANIASASLLEHTPFVADNSEFHFACNGSAILTEPWTDVLIRAMGSACMVFIRWLAAWQDRTDPMHVWVTGKSDEGDVIAQAGICIKGMKLLGRKSETANFTAEAFCERLEKVMRRRRTSFVHSDAVIW